MIERAEGFSGYDCIDEGEITFHCDFCEDTFETMTEDFSRALEIVKQEGWIVCREKGQDWQHFCSQLCKGRNYVKRFRKN